MKNILALFLLFGMNVSASANEIYWPCRQLPPDPSAGYTTKMDIELNPQTKYPAVAYMRMVPDDTYTLCHEICYGEFDGTVWNTQSVQKYSGPILETSITAFDLAFDAENRPVIAVGQRFNGPDNPPSPSHKHYSYVVDLFWLENASPPVWFYCRPHVVRSHYYYTPTKNPRDPARGIVDISLSPSLSPGMMSLAFSESRDYFFYDHVPNFDEEEPDDSCATFTQMYWYEVPLQMMGSHDATEEWPAFYGPAPLYHTSAFWSTAPDSTGVFCHLSQCKNTSGLNELCYTRPNGLSPSEKMLFWSYDQGNPLTGDDCIVASYVSGDPSFSINPRTGERAVAYGRSGTTRVSSQNSVGVWEESIVSPDFADGDPICIFSPTLGPIVALSPSPTIRVGVPNEPGLHPPLVWQNFTDRPNVCSDSTMNAMAIDSDAGSPYVAFSDTSSSISVCQPRRIVVNVTTTDGRLPDASFFVYDYAESLWEADYGLRWQHETISTCYLALIPPNKPGESRLIRVSAQGYEGETYDCPILGTTNTIVMDVTLSPDDCGTPPNSATAATFNIEALLPLIGGVVLLVLSFVGHLLRGRLESKKA